jgi:nitroreductase
VDVYEAIKARRSIRAYKPDAVPEDVLRRVLEAARLAPSARNRQEWRFLVVTEKDKIAKLAEAANGQSFVAEAPVYLAFCTTKMHVMGCGVDAGVVDTSIPFSYVTLAAVAEGLGTCWLGAFDQEKTREILDVPEDVLVVGVTPLGYPARTPAPTSRKSFEEVVGFESW